MDEIPSEPSRSALEEPTVIHVEALDIDGFEPAKVSADTGAASYAYINKAIDAALAGSVAAVTTAPINKEALAAAKCLPRAYRNLCSSRGLREMVYDAILEVITCTFVTVHVGYSEVRLLTRDRILEVIELSAENLADSSRGLRWWFAD